MKLLCLATALLAAQCASSPTQSSQNQKVMTKKKDVFDIIRQKLNQSNIINEVLDDFRPKCFIIPIYNNTGPVILGNKFNQSDTKTPPSVKIVCPKIISSPGLTIALTDPDAPSRDDPKWSEMCHWIATIGAGKSTAEGMEFEISKSSVEKEIVEYKPPGPPPNTGYHRYIFVLLEGNNTNLTAPSERQHWGTGDQRHGVRDWAKNESLEVVGANWFIEKNKKQEESSFFWWW